MDISTSFIQICGRIRNSRYKEEITHIYATSYYKDFPTLEEFKEFTAENIAKAESHAKWLNEAPEDIRQEGYGFVSHLGKPYIRVKDGKIIVDQNMANYDIVNYKIVHGIYRSQLNVQKELEKHGMNVIGRDCKIRELPDLLGTDKVSFKELFERYCTLMENNYITFSFEKEDIVTRKPLIKQAYETIGADEVRRLKYHQGNIKREIIKRGPNKYAEKIARMLELPLYEPISKKKIKKKIQQIYDDLGLNVKAKATDLNRWYNTQEVLRLEGGKNIACMKIIGKKYIFIDSY